MVWVVSSLCDAIISLSTACRSDVTKPTPLKVMSVSTWQPSPEDTLKMMLAVLANAAGN
jgi:hypothetical protein